MTQQPWPQQGYNQPGPAFPQPIAGWGAPPPPPAQAPQAPAGDPLETRVKVPSVSFDKDAAGNRLNPPVTYELEVIGNAEQVQQRDDKGKPEYWLDQWGRPENPKWNIVISVKLNGEVRGLWAKKMNADGSLFRAIQDAQREAGVRIGPGGKLTVQWYASEKATVAQHNDRKLYRAKYEPNVYAVAPTNADPFAAQTAQVAAAEGWGQPPTQPAPVGQPGYPAQPAQAYPPPIYTPPAAPQGPPAYQPPPASPAPVQPPPADPWANEPPPF